MNGSGGPLNGLVRSKRTQVSAARRGLEATALLVLEDHVNRCVRDAALGRRGLEKVEEMLEAVRPYVRSV